MSRSLLGLGRRVIMWKGQPAPELSCRDRRDDTNSRASCPSLCGGSQFKEKIKFKSVAVLLLLLFAMDRIDMLRTQERPSYVLCVCAAHVIDTSQEEEEEEKPRRGLLCK